MKNFILSLILFSLTGCAVFDKGNISEVNLPAYENLLGVKPSLSYSSKAIEDYFSVKPLGESGQKIIEEELLTVLNESNYFSSINNKREHSDIRLDVVLTNSGNPAALVPAVITGLSYFLIPSWATDDFNLVAKVKRKDGYKKEYILSDSTTLVQWLPLIVVYPFKSMSVIPEVRKNMYKKVLENMQQDGFFEYENFAGN